MKKRTTIWCWLFGHIFIGEYQEVDARGDLWKSAVPLDFCVRCGIKRDL